MSTRFYPRFVKGNPQLRVFLPDWKLIMIKPKNPMPENVVSFKTDVRMTDWDIKNYLEKIYKVQIASIKSVIRTGDLRRSSKGLTRADDYRLARVTLPEGQIFKWPELYPEDKKNAELTDYQKTLKQLNEKRTIDPNQRGVPTWLA